MVTAKKSPGTPTPLRQAFISELEKVFHSSDRKHNGRIDREEFEVLIKGYFDLKNISAY
jgi:Ca2+-binding EF-hand superfamily protein